MAATEWSAAIVSAQDSPIFATVNPNTGEMEGGVIRPYNEYYLVNAVCC